jgi:hypothetical protein
MSDTQVVSPEPTIAHPPRYWWTKRIAFLFVISLIALGGLRWWWGHLADSRIRELVNEAHARGERILPEDFVPTSIPDSQNAAVTLQLAANAMFLDSNSDAMDTTWRGGAFTPLEVSHTDAVAENNVRCLQLVRLARSQPQADWKISFQRPVSAHLTVPFLGPQRELAKIQEWVTLRDHAKGNDGEAIEHILDLLRQTDVLGQSASFRVMHLTGAAINGITTQLIERMAPNLRVTADNAPASGAAMTSQVRRVIAALLDERTVRGGAMRAWEGERMLVLDEAEEFATGQSAYGPTHPWIIAPLLRLDGVRKARNFSQVMPVFALPNRPEASAAMPVQFQSTDRSALEDFSRFLSGLSAGWSNRAAQNTFQMLTERRAAAVELALRLYRADHGGALPKKLSQLVPDYLPVLPADPMAAGGRTFGYHPGAQPPVIYSVGFDGIDDGGTSLADESRGQYRWKMADAVFPLASLPAATQPASTETDDHQ